jgi:hypothetical protein
VAVAVAVAVAVVVVVVVVEMLVVAAVGKAHAEMLVMVGTTAVVLVVAEVANKPPVHKAHVHRKARDVVVHHKVAAWATAWAMVRPAALAVNPALHAPHKVSRTPCAPASI